MRQPWGPVVGKLRKAIRAERYAPLNDGSFDSQALQEENVNLDARLQMLRRGLLVCDTGMFLYHSDILQFASAIFVADEAEEFTVSVMRLGQLDGEVRCHFRTEDAGTVQNAGGEGSGKAGLRFEHVEGDLIFPSGEFQQSIRIPIIESPLWLGRYLKHCRVKVIDRDTFPSSFYAQQIEEDVETISQTGLFIEYVKLVLEQPGNLWRFLITVAFDQLKNLYVWFTLKASVYMVNVVFGHREDAEDELLIRDDAAKTAQVLGLMYVLLPLLLHIWKVMRKYMNFSEESRLEVTQPEVVSFVMQKSEQLAGSISASA
eukprot:Skav220616  [mRNA]  locus=scaffold507:330226:336877:+ [translate_table: standard]